MRFAVHRPDRSIASPRSHGVSRRDVPGCVHVSVAGETTGRAYEARLALTRPRVHVPARRATLAREVRLDLFDPSAGLVFQPTHQQSPARPQDLSIEPGLSTDTLTRIPDCPPSRARHAADLQVLDTDHIEPACQVRAGLLSPVFAPVGFAGLQPRDGEPYPLAAVRPAAGASELPLQAQHKLALRRGQAGHVEQLPGGQGRRHRHTPVDPDDLAIFRRGNRLRNYGECDMPAPSPVHCHPVGLHARWRRARPTESHPSGLGHPDFAGFAAKPSNVLRFHGDNSEPLVPPNFPPRRPPGRVSRIEKGGYGLGKIPQGLLLHHLGACAQPRVLRAGFGELTALLQVAWSALAARMPVLVLLDREVPHVSGVGAMALQHRFLSGRGAQAIPGHTNILANITDIFGEVRRRFLPGLRTGAATPRSR